MQCQLIKLVESLLTTNKPGILSIENTENRSVSIHCLRNVGVGLVGLICRNKVLPSSNLVYKILEHSDDKFLALYHFSLYKSGGWSIETQVPIKPKLKRKLVGDDKSLSEIVYIATGRNNHIVLGIFRSKVEADQFIKLVPVVGDCIFPVVALNIETREYYKEEFLRKSHIADLLG